MDGLVEPEFFRRRTEQVAADLLGRKVATNIAEGYVTTVRAFDDLDTSQPSKQGALYEPGELFMMPFRGNYFTNISTESSSNPACVEIRGLYADENVEGPGKVTDELGLSPDDDRNYIGDTVRVLYDKVDESHRVNVNRSDIPSHQGAIAEYSLKDVDW